MKVDSVFRAAGFFEASLLVLSSSAIVLLPGAEASSLKAFELLGASLASMVTTAGLYGMKSLT
ncbi:MAG: hypothetical protein ABEJ03_04170 [Candidatus Nanohaloarchaea archaeon]